MIFEKQKTLKASDRFIQDICGLPDIVKNNTIILIGPMGTGKSTVAKLLENQIEGMHRISLDNKELLKNLYERERKFKDFKSFGCEGDEHVSDRDHAAHVRSGRCRSAGFLGGIAADLGAGRHYHVDFYGGCHGCLRNNHAVGDPEGSEENEGGIGRWIRFLQIQFLWAW